MGNELVNLFEFIERNLWFSSENIDKITKGKTDLTKTTKNETENTDMITIPVPCFTCF